MIWLYAVIFFFLFQASAQAQSALQKVIDGLAPGQFGMVTPGGYQPPDYHQVYSATGAWDPGTKRFFFTGETHGGTGTRGHSVIYDEASNTLINNTLPSDAILKAA